MRRRGRGDANLAAANATNMTAEVDHLRLFERLTADATEENLLARALARGLGVMKDAFRLYGPERLVTAFNGGKDAVVILHLSLVALAAHNKATNGAARLRVIFFETDDEFPEIDAFVKATAAQFNLEVVSSPLGFREGIQQCMDEHGSAAFVLGTRESDPNAGGQQDFSPSSDWLPPFMRVNPILTWSYSDVWAFLRGYELPYCELYDQGYTSLGKMASTQRNPALVQPDGSYSPAWQLEDASLERAGRISHAAAAAAPPTSAESA